MHHAVYINVDINIADLWYERVNDIQYGAIEKQIYIKQNDNGVQYRYWKMPQNDSYNIRFASSIFGHWDEASTVWISAKAKFFSRVEWTTVALFYHQATSCRYVLPLNLGIKTTFQIK